MTKTSRRGILLTLLYAGSLAVVAWLAVEGADYYGTPLVERPRHEDYWRLKPGGSRGLAYGIAGSGLMVLMLLYTVRKRLPGLRRLGSLTGWLDFHIFCGVVGPLLVVLHSSFKVHGLVALSFWSMVLVALSGIVGRYLYVQFPRRRSGDELGLAEARALSEELAERLRSEFRLPPSSLAELDRLAAAGAGAGTGLLTLLLRLPFDGLRLRWGLRGFRRSLGGRPDGLWRELVASARQRAFLERRIRLWDALQRLFHYWHVLHKPFALIMYLFMVVHVAVALATGYGWAWG